MGSRRAVWIVALALAALAAAAGWALARAAREPFVLLTVVATSVRAPAPGEAAGPARAAPDLPRLPLAARVGRLVVAVREEAFLHAVGARVLAPLRLPAAVPVGEGEVEIVAARPDGSLEISAAGRELRLPPGAAASVLFAGEAAPVWSDAGGELWREALRAALVEGGTVHVWRLANRGWVARAELRGLRAFAAGAASGAEASR